MVAEGGRIGATILAEGATLAWNWVRRALTATKGGTCGLGRRVAGAAETLAMCPYGGCKAGKGRGGSTARFGARTAPINSYIRLRRSLACSINASPLRLRLLPLPLPLSLPLSPPKTNTDSAYSWVFVAERPFSSFERQS